MKLLFDFFPIALFFVAFKLYGIYTATAVAIVASLVQVGWQRLRHGRFEGIHLATLALIVVLGGATLYFQNEMFIKWKPTLVNWLFSGVFLFSQLVGKRTATQRLLGEAIELPLHIWTRLNIIWSLFFLAMGAANLYVVYHFDTDIWVDFKLFGMMGLTLLFIIVQAFYVARHMKSEEETE
jgi:intracellular septation protein